MMEMLDAALSHQKSLLVVSCNCNCLGGIRTCPVKKIIICFFCLLWDIGRSVRVYFFDEFDLILTSDWYLWICDEFEKFDHDQFINYKFEVGNGCWFGQCVGMESHHRGSILPSWGFPKLSVLPSNSRSRGINSRSDCGSFGETEVHLRRRCQQHANYPNNARSSLKNKARFPTVDSKREEVTQVIAARNDPEGILRDWFSHVTERGIHPGQQRMSVVDIISHPFRRRNRERLLVEQNMFQNGDFHYLGMGRGCLNTYVDN